MTIKQHGGIFGRSPSFNTVEAAVLDVDNLRIDGNTISSTNANGNIALTPNGTGEVDIPKVDIDGGTIDGVTIGGASAGTATFTSATVNGNITVTGTVDGRDVAADGTKLDGIEAGADVTDATNVTAAGALMDSELTNITAVKALDQGVATTDSPSFAGITATTADINGGTIDGTVIGGSTPAAISGTTITATGDISVGSGGNLVFASGNGIDFSATAGTGTSELFDDYEEGTWTPVYTASTTDPTFASYPVRSAHYRKIGAMVFITARFRTSGYNSDGVGNLRISGLPYAAKSSGSFLDTGGIKILGASSFSTAPTNGIVTPSDAFISLMGSTPFVEIAAGALGTGANNNDISIFGMYVTD